jgi:hypothetical protein
MQVEIRGKVYENAKAAAKANGVAVASVYFAIIRGNPDRLGKGIDYKARKTKGGLPPKPVVIAGQRFESMAALARAIGRPSRSVRTAWNNGRRAPIVLAVLNLIADRENRAMKESAR